MMELADIVGVLKSITYKGHKADGMLFATTVWFGDEKGYDIRIRIEVNDRTTGEDAGGLYTHYTYGPEEVKHLEPSNIVRRVKSMLIYLETHEVEEQLLYKGRRVFDPHRPKLVGPLVKTERRMQIKRLEEVKKSVIAQMKEKQNDVANTKET
jgi:hypothetical protein